MPKPLSSPSCSQVQGDLYWAEFVELLSPEGCDVHDENPPLLPAAQTPEGKWNLGTPTELWSYLHQVLSPGNMPALIGSLWEPEQPEGVYEVSGWRQITGICQGLTSLCV